MITEMNRFKKILRKIVPKGLLSGGERAYRVTRGVFWLIFYGFAPRGARVIAVTGTNGKTTTANYINEALKACGLKTALYSTALIEVAGKSEPNRTHFTLISQRVVQQFFARAKKARVDFVILEVTSHALDQNRILGVPIEVAVMTNLTQDHLDYHGTMDEYARAKSLLFSKYRPKISILNLDDKWYEYLKERASGRTATYGRAKQATFRLLKTDPEKAEFEFEKKKYSFNINLMGTFNAYNALAAIATGVELGQKMEDLCRGVENLKKVPGRMEEVSVGQEYRVYVDFAYTPDALEKALSSLREVTKGKVRIVFGATGDRDKSKRPIMGRVVSKFADAIYLTDDETYSENAGEIRRDVMAGITKEAGRDKTQEIADRKEAMRKAFDDAKAGDVILITGLGHETERNMAGRLIAWDDREVAKELLRKNS